MRWNVLVLLVCSLVAVGVGCKKRETPNPVPKTSSELDRAQGDVCRLITSEEIGVIQASPIKEAKGSTRSDNGFRVSQCFYTATEFSKSVSLAVVQKDPDNSARRSPKDFWKEKFGRFTGDEEARDRNEQESGREEEEERLIPPKQIDDIGDQAYWVSNRFGGVLYVLKGDAFISIGLGGTDDEETKLNKSKALAQKALQRL
jgi:hypothetical protein